VQNLANGTTNGQYDVTNGFTMLDTFRNNTPTTPTVKGLLFPMLSSRSRLAVLRQRSPSRPLWLCVPSSSGAAFSVASAEVVDILGVHNLCLGKVSVPNGTGLGPFSGVAGDEKPAEPREL